MKGVPSAETSDEILEKDEDEENDKELADDVQLTPEDHPEGTL